jgi:hypothetical protein
LFSVILVLSISFLVAIGTKNEVVSPIPSTTSRDLPAWFKDAYMKSCSENGQYDYCLCTINYLDDNYSNERLFDMSTQFAKDEKMTPEMSNAISSCMNTYQ